MDVGGATTSEYAHTIFKGKTEAVNSEQDRSIITEKASPYAE